MIEPFYSFADLRTVQGVLERAIKYAVYFKFINFLTIYSFICLRFALEKKCEVCCSSRTDARVHALSSSFHFDWQHSNEKLDIEYLLEKLNTKLNHAGAGIRVNNIEAVDADNFMAYRNVAFRSYLYRIAVRKRNIEQQIDPNEIGFPIEETDRCYFMKYIKHF